jgi:hypothetical protein
VTKIITAEEIRAGIAAELVDPDHVARHPYGHGELTMQVRALGMLGFDVEVGVELMNVEEEAEPKR